MSGRPDTDIPGSDTLSIPPSYPGEVKKDPMAGLTDQEKDLMDEMKGLKWNEFTQNTTFHGVKYIFEETPFKMRRVLWVFTVVTSIVFFTVMVGVRTEQYLKHEANIALDLTFVDQVPFPALTMCNQNAFRMSKAIDLGLYYFVDNVYSAGNMSDMDLSSYNLTILADDFLSLTAHQLDDLIDTCTWMGAPCNISRDFTVTYTDLGVCYTFNGDLEAVKYVDDTAYALSLVINVEQYEHMRGPQNDAGLKMLLHSQDETPLMKERGFAVAPGTHTLASVSMTRKLSLEPPWGKCSMVAPAITDCKVTHRTNYLVDACNCRQNFMNQSSIAPAVPKCTLKDRYSCILAQDTKNMKVKSDSCPLPCNITEYDPSLSYAQLSSINIDRLALTDPIRKADVLERFHHAMESLHRADKTLKEADVNSLTMMLEEASTLNQRLVTQTATITEDSDFENNLHHFKDYMEQAKENTESLHDVLERIVKMENDFLSELVQGCFIDLIGNIAKREEDFDYFRECTDKVQPSNLTLPFVEFPMAWVDDDWLLMQCKKENEFSEEYSDEGSDQEPDDVPMGPPKVLTPQEIERACQDSLTPFLEELQWANKFSATGVNYILGLSELYSSTVIQVFNDTDQNVTEFDKHEECIEAIAEFEAEHLEYLQKIADTVRNVLNASDYTDLNATITAFEELVATPEVIGNLTDHLKTLEKSCWWMEKRMEEEKEETYDAAIERFQYAETSILYLQESRKTIEKKMEKIQEHIVESIDPILMRAELFLGGHITKLQMSEVFDDMLVTKALEDLLTMSTDLKSAAASFKSMVSSVLMATKVAFGYLNKAVPPVLNTDNLRSFVILQYANASSVADINDLWDVLGEDKDENVKEIIDQIMKTEFKDPITSLISEIYPIISKLASLMSARQTVSSAFISQNAMDRAFFMENFLQVDIFFKELSYEIVEQKQAFSLTSLFGEVGGFLGLLLGASILTMCELVDYMTMICITKCKKKGRGTGGRREAGKVEQGGGYDGPGGLGARPPGIPPRAPTPAWQ